MLLAFVDAHQRGLDIKRSYAINDFKFMNDKTTLVGAENVEYEINFDEIELQLKNKKIEFITNVINLDMDVADKILLHIVKQDITKHFTNLTAWNQVKILNNC